VRVLLDYRPALRERTGVGEYAHQLVRALLAAAPPDRPAGRDALELAIFSSSWRDRLTATSELAGALVIDRRVPGKLLNLAWHRLEWPPAEQIAGHAFDVTHSLHPLLLPARNAAQVVTVHDLDFLAHPERTRAEIRRDYPALARAHAQRADRVIAVTQFTSLEVQRQLGVPAERISVCPPGAPAWEPRRQAPADGYILFVGTLEPRKNLGALLDAYALLASRRRDVPKLVVAGRALPGAEPWLDRMARAPLRGHVEHVGYVEAARRRALYEGARLLVQPSFNEGFGMPVLEAMTVGVPVVSSNRGALPEVLGDAGPLVDPDDREALASAVARLLDDEAFAAACAAQGVRRARQFSWNATAQGVYEAYRRAIERRCASV
jgi:glycosyltransferase involved in cell wall biosynthesis